MRLICALVLSVSCTLCLAMAQDPTAVITGEVVDINGSKIVNAKAELSPDGSETSVVSSVTDGSGVYRFSGLHAGQYTLKLSRNGFVSLKVKSVSVLDGEHKLLPPLELTVAIMDNCGATVVDYVRLLPHGSPAGGLGGSVKVYLGPLLGNDPSVPNAEVILFNGKNRIKSVKTNAKGEFLFDSLPAGQFTIRIRHAGFYLSESGNYQVQEGRELIYQPIRIERCPHGNCDPRSRPKRPLIVCG